MFIVMKPVSRRYTWISWRSAKIRPAVPQAVIRVAILRYDSSDQLTEMREVLPPGK